jgi:hypothetical protein
VVIKASSSAEIRSLLDALAASDAVEREAAIARLAVIGSRAVDRLLAVYRGTSDPDLQTAVLRALEPIADPRVLPMARDTLDRGGDAAVVAARLLHAILRSSDEAAATKALDALVSAALNPAADRRVRVAAFEALAEMPDTVRSPVGRALGTDLGFAAETAAGADDDALWADALDGRLPADPAQLREATAARAIAAPPGSLRKLIEAVRTAEAQAASPRRMQWRALRGALHQALALRGSRIAAYDLRESLESTRDPLPASFLAAIHAVGDASFIDPLAAALSRASSNDVLWRHHLASTFRAVARREGLTRRHAVIKRAMAKWPDMPLPL